jgi:signal transduction histidine kinase
MRNAHGHASATAATIQVAGGSERMVMVVADDGQGFDTAALEQRAKEGHFGLRVVRDLVEDAGGTLEVLSAPGRGTTVRVEVPR